MSSSSRKQAMKCIVCGRDAEKGCGLCAKIGVENIWYCSPECAKQDWPMHKILHEEDKGARYRCTVNSDRSLSAYFNVTNPGNKKTTTVQFRIDSMCTCAVISPEVADLLELKFIKADETNFFFGRKNLADGNWVHAPKHPLEFSLAGRPLPFVPVIDAFIPSTRGSYNLIGMDFFGSLVCSD